MADRRFRGVSDLIYRGFLTTKAQVGDVHIVLKSLNHRELASIQDRCPLQGHSSYFEIFEALFLSYAIYIMDGENLLIGRPQNIEEMLPAMREVPQNIRLGLLRELLILQRAQDTALLNLEAYSYTGESRHNWGAYRGQIICDSRLTGVAGTDTLGLNTHQTAWVYLNQQEDIRLEAEQQWAFVKFVASASNPKGVKKIDSQDKARQKKLREDRDRVIQGNLYKGPHRIEPKTVDDLHRQLRADLEGTKDLHDRIIEAYETSIAERRRQRQLEQEEKLRDIRAERERELAELSPEELAGGAGFVTLLSKDQLSKHREEQTAARRRFVNEMTDRRQQIHEQQREDRYVARDRVNKLIEEEKAKEGPPPSLTIPTGEHGPMRHTDTQPAAPRTVDTRPKANPRLAGPSTSPAPQAAPQGTRKPPTPPAGTERVGTRSDGTPVYYSADPRAQSKPPEGTREERSISGMPSQRLTRHTYGDPNQIAKARSARGVKKSGHTVAADVEGEEDFFGGGGTTFTDKPAKK